MIDSIKLYPVLTTKMLELLGQGDSTPSTAGSQEPVYEDNRSQATNWL